MKLQYALSSSLAASLTLILAACPGAPSVDAAEDPAGPGTEDPGNSVDSGFFLSNVTFDRSLPDRNVEDPLPGCTPGDQRLTAQNLSGTASLELDVGGNFGLNRVTVEDGVYLFAIQLRDPFNCQPMPGAVGPELRVEFDLVYTGAVEDFGDGLCVTASKVAFSSFVFSGASAIDGWIETAVRDQVLRSLDVTHLELLPTVTPEPGSDARCSNWDPLP